MTNTNLTKQLSAKGGTNRAAVLSPERRAEIARRGAQARWSKPRPPKPPSLAETTTTAPPASPIGYSKDFIITQLDTLYASTVRASAYSSKPTTFRDFYTAFRTMLDSLPPQL